MLGKVAWLGFVTLLCPGILAGQRPAVPSPGGPRFDVVSIKVNNSGHNGSAWGDSCESGRWTARNVNVSTIVVTAFGLMEAQIQGVPAWNNHPLHQLDITAICPAGAAARQLQPMLQAMLVNRFHFSGRFETRAIPVRTLELAKSGAKLKPPSGDCVPASPGPPLPQGQHACGQFYATRTWPDAAPGRRSADGTLMIVHYQAWSASIADFLDYFASEGPIGQPPMVDLTGLKGKYDFDFEYEAIRNEKDAEGHLVNQHYKSVQAMEKQLGLIYNDGKLKKMPMPVLVINHLDMPTAN